MVPEERYGSSEDEVGWNHCSRAFIVPVYHEIVNWGMSQEYAAALVFVSALTAAPRRRKSRHEILALTTHFLFLYVKVSKPLFCPKVLYELRMISSWVLGTDQRHIGTVR
jgi:hypothetical protein